MLIENVTHQMWQPNPMCFIPSPGYISQEEVEERSKQWYSFLLSELQRHYHFLKQIDDTSTPVFQALRFLLTAVCRYPSSQALVEESFLSFLDLEQNRW